MDKVVLFFPFSYMVKKTNKITGVGYQAALVLNEGNIINQPYLLYA
jgi:hypothetical protein